VSISIPRIHFFLGHHQLNTRKYVQEEIFTAYSEQKRRGKEIIKVCKRKILK
jgi:hypothetical protein